MILWIHGFRSCGLSDKSQALRAHFGADQVLTPDLPHRPAEAIALLEELLVRYPMRAIAGASLGGYYATWLLRRHDLPAVLVNPAVVPHLLLENWLGWHRDCHGRPFEVTRDTLRALRALRRARPAAHERYLVLLATGDEVLDWRTAADYYADKELIVHPGGDHRFTDFPHYLPQIARWLADHAQETPRSA